MTHANSLFRLFRLLLLLTAISPLIAAQTTPKQPATKAPLSADEIRALDLYCQKLDFYAERPNAPLRAFNATEPAKELSSWQEVAWGEQQQSNNSAWVLFQHQQPARVEFTRVSPSGDWTQIVKYYFRADGTLACRHSRLNTFYGNLSVLRDYYYDAEGKLLKESSRMLDLKTQKKKKKPDGEFLDQPVQLYKTVTELPFYKLLPQQGAR